jgi:hypothetical protein
MFADVSFAIALSFECVCVFVCRSGEESEIMKENVSSLQKMLMKRSKKEKLSGEEINAAQVCKLHMALKIVKKM